MLQEQATKERTTPALWYEAAPLHFDVRIPWWFKALAVAICAVVAILFLDQRIAVYARDHAIPDLARQAMRDPTGRPVTNRYGDTARELMFLEQWGQGVCSVLAIVAVGLMDRAGRRRALSIVIGCLLTVLLSHLLKDMIGRSRPYIATTDGSWVWGGPAMGFTKGSSWGSFPSAHTTGAFALSAGLSWYYPRARALFMSLAVVTAAQRVLHTAHYLSDVIAGMGISVMVMRGTLAAKLAGRLIALAPPTVRGWWLTDNR